MISAKPMAVVVMLGVMCGIVLALLTSGGSAVPPPDRVGQPETVEASAPKWLMHSTNNSGKRSVAVLDRIPFTFGETEVLRPRVVGQIQMVGNWTAWSLDGSIDETRTGFYVNGMKIR